MVQGVDGSRTGMRDRAAAAETPGIGLGAKRCRSRILGPGLDTTTNANASRWDSLAVVSSDVLSASP